MKTFKDFLLEQSQAVKGDWIGDPKNPTLHLDTTGERAFNKKFKLEVEDFATIKGISLSLYKHKTEPNFRVGYWKEIKEAIKGDFEIVNKFVTVVYLDADRNKDIQRKINKKFAMNIKMVFVDDSFRNNALARVLYNYIIHVKGYAIIGDKKQYFGARKLWSRLSKANDVIVDIINIKQMRYYITMLFYIKVIMMKILISVYGHMVKTKSILEAY